MIAGERIRKAIERRNASGEPALAPFLTAGFPTLDRFVELLREVESEADLVEIGVPFSDPMADGVTIQRSSRIALEQGAYLEWILSTLESHPSPTPRILMSYYNPILAYGLDRLATRVRGAGIDALIIPDLPFEEQGEIRAALFETRVGIVQLVTPVTPPNRRRSLGEATAGFLYAVTVTGTTGGASTEPSEAGESLAEYLTELSRESPAPVLAGFGVRSAEQLAAIAKVAAGAVVGSALIEAIEGGQSPTEFLQTLRQSKTEVESRRPVEVSP